MEPPRGPGQTLRLPLSIQVDSRTYGGSVRYDRHPDTCPTCHCGVSPKVIGASVSQGHTLEIAYQCTLHSCERMFLGVFKARTADSFYLSGVLPLSARPVQIASEVAKLSPSFLEIYSQALAAEVYQLTEIVGVGLRKALEFLVKDYCIHQNPAEREAIEKLRLGGCIDAYIDDSRVKRCAKRAAWLGNDETHYIRRWSDLDIDDLKNLIHLTMNFVDSDLVSKQYEGEMPDSAAKGSP